MRAKKSDPLPVALPPSMPVPGGTVLDLVRRPKNVPVPESGIVVFESRHAPGFVGELQDGFSKWFLVIAGRAQWKGGGRDAFLGPDTLCHIPAGLPHRQKDLPGEPLTVYCIHYLPGILHQDLQTRLASLGMLTLALGSAQISQTRLFHSLFREMLFEQDGHQEGWQSLLGARLLEVTVRALRLAERHGHRPIPRFDSANDSAERMSHYILRLQSRFFTQESLDDAARSVGVSRRHFTELFRKLTGKTWRQYVLELRLEHAARLLVQSQRSVVAVAFECGFDDLSHFHHCFKKAFSATPSAYRDRNQPSPAPAFPPSKTPFRNKKSS